MTMKLSQWLIFNVGASATQGHVPVINQRVYESNKSLAKRLLRMRRASNLLGVIAVRMKIMNEEEPKKTRTESKKNETK